MTSKTRKYILIVIVFNLSQTACENEVLNRNSFQKQLNALNATYKDSLKAQHGGLTSEFLIKWGNRYWNLVKENPNHKKAPLAAKKAFSIYEITNNPVLMKQKLEELSIHDRALSGILQYWESLLYEKYVDKLKHIASQSNSKGVKVAAHLYLAKYFTKYKLYDQALEQLNTLELSFQVYESHHKYGKKIENMRTAVDRFAAGKYLPELKFIMLSGDVYSTKDLKNQVTFIYFYGSGCGSCIKMYPKISKLYSHYGNKGFNVIGLALDWNVNYGFSTPAEYKKFAQEYYISWPQATNYEPWEAMRINALSTGYLINQKGKIVRISRSDVVTNAVEKFEETSLREALTMLLAE